MRNKELETSRDKLLESVLTRINTWDMSIESGIQIIETNEMDIKKIQNYNEKIFKQSSESEAEGYYKQKINEVTNGMVDFLEKMEEKKKILLEEKNLFLKNSDAHTNYISSDFKAVFIDKNV